MTLGLNEVKTNHFQLENNSIFTLKFIIECSKTKAKIENQGILAGIFMLDLLDNIRVSFN